MLSPVSGRYGSNLVSPMSNRVQSSPADGKVMGVKPLSGGNAQQALGQAIDQLEQMVDQLMAMLRRSGAVPQGAELGASGASGASAPVQSSGGCNKGGGMPTQDSFAPGGAAAPAGMPSLSGTGNSGDLLSGIQVSDPKLRQALEQIASHPDGAKLIAAAKANGLTSLTANPGLNPDGGAGTEGLTIYGGGNTRIEIANPNGSNLIHTLAHELGHAATTGDGNSQLEEKTIDELGERIQRDLTGQGSSFHLDLGSYSNLALNNGVLNSLRGLGIRV
jgi:hypothetical protein